VDAAQAVQKKKREIWSHSSGVATVTEFSISKGLFPMLVDNPQGLHLAWSQGKRIVSLVVAVCFQLPGNF
jgi:hypothetical protein